MTAKAIIGIILLVLVVGGLIIMKLKNRKKKYTRFIGKIL